jgi:hypothetical protein
MGLHYNRRKSCGSNAISPVAGGRICSELGEKALASISPYILFPVLLRQVSRAFEKRGAGDEPKSQGRRRPVFEAPAVI